MKDALKYIKELAAQRERLARKAEPYWADQINAVIEGRITDCKHIEKILDGLLDFCFDPAMLRLFKTMARYYFQINPLAAEEYVNIYREMWDSDTLPEWVP